MRIKRSGMKQNNDIPDKTMERIRKLMRLKESTTSEGEARETALTCCHDALIDKYLEKIGAGTSKAHPRKRPEPTAPRITQAWVTAGTSV